MVMQMREDIATLLLIVMKEDALLGIVLVAADVIVTNAACGITAVHVITILNVPTGTMETCVVLTTTIPALVARLRVKDAVSIWHAARESVEMVTIQTVHVLSLIHI